MFSKPVTSNRSVCRKSYAYELLILNWFMQDQLPKLTISVRLQNCKINFRNETGILMPYNFEYLHCARHPQRKTSVFRYRGRRRVNSKCIVHDIVKQYSSRMSKINTVYAGSLVDATTRRRYQTLWYNYIFLYRREEKGE